MAFDQTTRNRLARFVSEARALLTEEFTRQLQNEYGLDPASGDVTPIDRLTALDDRQRETARILRETMDYYLAGNSNINGKADRDVMDRIVREQAFTVLNRLCALRMSEARGLVLEAIAKGYQSKGFQLYARLAGSALGETGETYRLYLFSLMDEFAVDLPVLFDRFSPQGRLFPREAVLLKLLELINDAEIDSLWSEDETIGWIYQYFNTKEERKAMRDASQAPRNSRELAVRNQFFTPRYVVEFLTDNTLGRIWYEMTRGETFLKDSCSYLLRRPNEIFLNEGEAAPEQPEIDENLSQEDLLRQLVFIPHRPLKDPREIKMLDPACGSMHFGLYAFDLFEQIYAESWDLEERLGEDAFQRLADLSSLHKTYSDRKTYLQDVPRLIIERNIHGVDIDPRAVQIAGLSLWSRAQKSWQKQGLRQSERPQIRKSNVVCAEPMPGDMKMLEEFLDTLKGGGLEELMRKVWHVPTGQKVRATPQMADALSKIVRNVWQEMELAGEAGSLLKIEETLRDAIAIARKESEEKSPLFRVLEYGLHESPKEQYVQLVDGKDQDFFDRAEGLVLAALKNYSEQAVNGSSFRRRLFAGDAANGFAFIDLCRKNYDAVLMNPPFGEASNKGSEYLEEKYPKWNKNILCAFCEKAIDLTGRTGKIGAIIDKTALVKSSYSAFREETLSIFNSNHILVDFGWGVLDANVETGGIVLSKSQSSCHTILQVSRYDLNQKGRELSQLVKDTNGGSLVKGFYLLFPEDLRLFPNGSIPFDIENWLIPVISHCAKFENIIGRALAGNSLKADINFRLFWELPNNSEVGKGKYWSTVYNGGEFSRYFTIIRDVTRYGVNGDAVPPHISTRWCNMKDQQKPGVGWGKRGDFVDTHIMPTGSVFTVEGQGLPIEDEKIRWFTLGFMNSPFFSYLMNIFCGQHKYAGYVNACPVPNISSELIDKITLLTENIVSILRKIASQDETSREFVGINLHEISSIGEFSKNQFNERLKLAKRIAEYDEEISTCVFQWYKVPEEGRIKVLDFWNRSPNINKQICPFENENEIKQYYVKRIISLIVGVIFKRWNASIVLKPHDANSKGYFDELPWPPYATEVVEKVNLSSEIFSNDDTNDRDLFNSFRQQLDLIWGMNASNIEQEICSTLQISSLREYINQPLNYFTDHFNTYSQSHRLAPIYWPLSTPSCSYTLWLYYHHLNDQTLYTCVNDFVDPKLKQVSEEVARLRFKKGRSAADEKGLERLTEFERELKDFREELLRVAKFWKPNLVDGVEITAAPLWKLFQHKPWQKRLKETWQKLEAGEYDWAHLAYSIWPERVREKCKNDKSLAIAHDLEELYVEPPASAKKKKAKKPAVDEETEGWFNDD